MNVDEQINLAKRFYYSKVGRGKEMIINFDYIKSTSEHFGNKQEYQVIGDMCDKWKRFTQDFIFDGEPVIKELKRVSTPGRRVYLGVDNLPKVRQGLGVAIVSTSKGIMSDAKARQSRVGGEVLCTVF